MCNSLLGRSKARKAAEAQAKAEKTSAERAASADTEAMRSNQISRESAIARDRASELASQYLDQPSGEVDVSVASGIQEDVDPITGRRRPARASFINRGSGASSSGLVI